MPSHTFTTDDLVVIDPAFARPGEETVVYRVREVHRVNLIAAPVTGGRPIRAPKDMFQPAPDNTITAASQQDSTPPTPEATPTILWPGSVVMVAGPGWHEPAGQLHVVLRVTGDKVSLVQLGGDNGRYRRGVHRSFCTVVNPSRINHTPVSD
ncbi:hypothetical protein GA0074692_0859 [Micromonospora pallida]|uniref:Uncharacterized protein n=1 Tax=Micromonospora pallida TaxID=145854 RepID=A0A1C6RT81_9ACTN|nr:hypothetical protein [Micromonospora pallida]SCL20403.1 hypothetical protein GA0074692_0859 [Micromonospora pallida]